jgi:hypothetical protein
MFIFLKTAKEREEEVLGWGQMVIFAPVVLSM